MSKTSLYSKANLPHINQSYLSIFDTIYPYKHMNRCLVNRYTGNIEHEIKTAEILALYNYEKYDVMLKLDAFYYKIRNNKYGINIEVADYVDEFIVPVFTSGFRIHPLFLNAYGEIIPYVLIGCHLASADIVDGTLRSTPDSLPITGVDVKELTKRAVAKSNKFGIYDAKVHNALFILYINEYKTLDIQSVLGKGCTERPSSGAHRTGDTFEMLNMSGYISDNGMTSNSYRGIEDWYSNIYTILADTYFDSFKVMYTSTSRYLYGEHSTYTQMLEYSRLLDIREQPGFSPNRFILCEENPIYILPDVSVNILDSPHKDELYFESAGYMMVGGHTQSSYKAGLFNGKISSDFSKAGTRLVYYPM